MLCIFLFLFDPWKNICNGPNKRSEVFFPLTSYGLFTFVENRFSFLAGSWLFLVSLPFWLWLIAIERHEMDTVSLFFFHALAKHYSGQPFSNWLLFREMLLFFCFWVSLISNRQPASYILLSCVKRTQYFCVSYMLYPDPQAECQRVRCHAY